MKIKEQKINDKVKDGNLKTELIKDKKINDVQIDLDHLQPKLTITKSKKENADVKYANLKTDTDPYASKNLYIAELIMVSIIIGSIFDWAIWQSMFELESTENTKWIARLLAIVVAIVAAFSCSKLGEAMAIRSTVNERDDSLITNKTELAIYKQVTAKNDFVQWLSICIMLAITVAGLRAYQSHQMPKGGWITVPSLVMTSISIIVGLAVVFFSNHIHCVYSKYINKAKTEAELANRNYNKVLKQWEVLDKKRRQLTYNSTLSDSPLIVATYGSPSGTPGKSNVDLIEEHYSM